MSRIKSTLLIVDDEPNVIESFKVIFEDKYNIISSGDGKGALQKARNENIDVAILDIMLPDMDGIEVLRKIRAIDPEVQVIMVTAVKTIKSAIDAMKLGAYDYITKPFEVEDVILAVQKAIEKRTLKRDVLYFRSEIKQVMFENIIGRSKPMHRVYELIKEMGRVETTVLISGESGTGKELVARAVHFNGTRKDKHFVAVDCGAIPERLIENELFGHERGAYTDAAVLRIGKFEIANGGTLFLDEIGNMEIGLQSKILRAIEGKEIQRIGGTKNIKLDVRIMSSTNADLKKAVEERKFREDLYYRLNVMEIRLPELRERKEDIPLLAEHFIKTYNMEFNKNIKGISADALKALTNYNWPGNVRELRNVIERAVVLSRGDILTPVVLPADILFSDEAGRDGYARKITFKNAKNEFEKQFIRKVMEKTNNNQTKAAKLLGVHRNTIRNKLSPPRTAPR
ncbi:MAG: sigma-54 dependent transcriptional regulator [Elusimicrobia bacterium]|nr:sigma-54 dependent transcriptional regulator [Elusimicrobiota bacterium]